MQIVTLNRFVEFDGVQVAAEVPQVWSDGFATAFRSQIPHAVRSIRPLNGEYRQYRGEALHGKALLLWRTGGFGDLLFLTPLLAELKRRYPTCRLSVACRPKYHGVFLGNPDVDQLLPLPVPLPTLETHDYHLHFEGTIERSADAGLHAVDLFARHAGVTLTDRRLVFNLSEDHQDAGRRFLRRYDRTRSQATIAVQVRASSPVRTYPWPLLDQVVKDLAARGRKVYLLGGPGDSPGLKTANVIDLCGAFPEMLDSVAIMAACDLLIAPDSSLTHFAGALDLPTVALYGPFPGKVRTQFYPRCVTLEAKTPCSPCFTHGHLPCAEARKRGQTHSPCFFHLPPERVLAEAERLLADKEAPCCT